MAPFDLSTIDITPKLAENTKIINAYGEKHFNISGEKFEHNIILTSTKVEKYNSFNDIAEYLNTVENIIVLLGTNNEQTKLEFKSLLDEKLKPNNIMISLEAMSLSAACRTYNILVSEERNVIAILLIDN